MFAGIMINLSLDVGCLWGIGGDRSGALRRLV
jgi:hypothetical protein